MKKLLICAATALLVLMGCAGGPEVKNAGSVVTTEYDKDGKPLKSTEQRTDYASYLKTFEAGGAGAAPKAVEIECGQTGCPGLKMVVYQTGGAQPRAVPQPPPVVESDGWKVWREIKETALGITPWIVGGNVMSKAFSAATQAVSNVTTTNTNVTASGAGAGAAAGGSATGGYSAPVATTTTTNTATTTTTNSNNVARNCNGGAGATGGNGGGTTTGGAGAAGGSGGPANC